jgi:hypothetical protein
MVGVFDLPTSLLIGLLADWLNAISFLHLDSACCSAVSRKAYLEVIESGEWVLPLPPHSVTRKRVCIEWFISRKVKKVKSFCVEADLQSPSYIHAVITFLRVSGAHLECIHCNTFKSTLLATVVLETACSTFSRLRILVLKDCALLTPVSIGLLLRATSATLKRLKLKHCFLADLITTSPRPRILEYTRVRHKPELSVPAGDRQSQPEELRL